MFPLFLANFFRHTSERDKAFMHMIVGLGNPGNRYQFTRHNIGFMVLENLAGQQEVVLKQKSFNAIWGKGKITGKNVILALPQTYMNLSGTSVRNLLAYFKADINDLIVVHDDLDLPFGTIRFKTGGGNAGHKGLASIVDNLGSADFMRVRLGIGKPQDKSRVEGYVLEPFNKEEQSVLPDIITMAANAIPEIIVSGIQMAMGKYHSINMSNSLKEEE